MSGDDFMNRVHEEQKLEQLRSINHKLSWISLLLSTIVVLLIGLFEKLGAPP